MSNAVAEFIPTRALTHQPIFFIQDQASLTRQCGSCSMCCTVPLVDEGTFYKAPYTKCKHQGQSETGSCGIFNTDERPNTCKKFDCAWRRGFGTDEDRPDKSGLMLSINNMNGGWWIFGIEDRDRALYAAKHVVIQMMNTANLPAIISKHDARPPNDLGDYVVVRRDMLPRAQRIIGSLIDYLDTEQEFGVYQLRIG
jgi:hypothetical protein